MDNDDVLLSTNVVRLLLGKSEVYNPTQNCTIIRRELRRCKHGGIDLVQVSQTMDLIGCRNPLDTRIGFALSGIEWVSNKIDRLTSTSNLTTSATTSTQKESFGL